MVVIWIVIERLNSGDSIRLRLICYNLAYINFTQRSMSPLISICIPAYKNVSFLKRLLESIAIQTFKEFEVLISDDSPDNGVQTLVTEYNRRIAGLQYWKNVPARGMPENWNTAIGAAKGTWIKIMHDDDWFLTADALEQFAKRTATEADFIFSNYENNYMDTAGRIIRKKPMVFPRYMLAAIAKEPLLLLADNKIGPPSVSMVRRVSGVSYDKRLRWRVDIDYYKTVLTRKPKLELLEELLIGVGMNENQVTNQTKNIPEVELPEAHILIQKYGTASLRNWIVYDSWWRMFRNMQIDSYRKLQQYVPQPWPPVIVRMLNFMEKTPKLFLKSGVTSKLCMLLSFAGGRASI